MAIRMGSMGRESATRDAAEVIRDCIATRLREEAQQRSPSPLLNTSHVDQVNPLPDQGNSALLVVDLNLLSDAKGLGRRGVE